MSTILSFDIGTTGVKTCLYTVTPDDVCLVDTDYATYSLFFLPEGGAEQDPEEWWQAIAQTTRSIASRQASLMSDLSGITFCSQMQSVVLVDESGLPVRRSLSYMDQRSTDLRKQKSGHGPKIAGVGLPLLVRSLYHTGVVAASDKDPPWKYLWVKHHEPDIFARAYKWLDVKESLIARMCRRFVMSRDSAFATLLMNKKDDRFSQSLLRKLGITPDHLPEIVSATDCVGRLLPGPAKELGLREGIKVFAGGGDASLVGLGAGCVRPGQGHIYMGTSGWASVITDKRVVDTSHMIASVVGVQPGLFNYFAELETAGKCLEWVRDHLALDEINIYLEKTRVTDDPGTQYHSLYDYLSQVISTAEAGSGGVLFAPWLHGNRCPFEDAYARGIFFNIGLETGKTEMIRAVIEGICYHLRWSLEVIEQKLPVDQTLRFVGGGALSEVTASILADILERPIELVVDPQNVGALGGALVAAVGLGVLPDLEATTHLIVPRTTFEPNEASYPVHRQNFRAFKELYRRNKAIFEQLNQSNS